MIPWISLCLVGFAAFFSWRLSRPISAALWIAFGSTCAYVLAIEYFPEAHARGAFEAQRLVSLVVGCAGVWELMTRTHMRSVCAQDAPATSKWHRHYAFSRPDLLALACVASCAVDFVAYAGFYHGLAWSLPYVQSGVCAGMVGLCVWPRKEGAT